MALSSSSAMATLSLSTPGAAELAAPKRLCVMSISQGPNWLTRQYANLQSGVFAAASPTCKKSLGVASISEMFSKLGGGSGGGWGRGGGGGGGGGGGFEPPAAGDSALGTSGDDASNSVTEDVIFLSVGGMSCGGCSASVKRILEAQPQVREATVDLATETATVQITSEPVASSGWEVVKRQLGESLAKHLTSCGFKSSLKEDGDKEAATA